MIYEANIRKEGERKDRRERRNKVKRESKHKHSCHLDSTSILPKGGTPS